MSDFADQWNHYLWRCGHTKKFNSDNARVHQIAVITIYLIIKEI